ncbi:unnamed protein product [Bemisia tabaci]|uniref:Uncharacterized protein n=1 Tax=Bemisia tabaci TaxID=7038 RepID=A0A9P0AGG5_BEMTA|nr:unnamed protein product [Bemisia tabaci]
MQEFCIATDLVCDQIDHCGDGSDEFVGPHCVSDEYRQILGMSLSYVITVLVCVLVILLVCIGACFCMGWLGLCHCPNRRSRQPDPNRSALAPQTTITPHYPMTFHLAKKMNGLFRGKPGPKLRRVVCYLGIGVPCPMFAITLSFAITTSGVDCMLSP